MSKKSKKVMIHCATAVDKTAVRRESINGVEHIIINSFTLPDNIVMNGGLYPTEEISKSFKTLERTLAPIEHPTDNNGNYISANDPIAIHNFHAGAFNVNVTQSDGRVRIEKHINVQQALKSEKGKRLLDRINELETNDSPRPIHTSVGVYINIDDMSAPQINESGQEYTWVANNMEFDHDAILLDSVGAAQPSQGVGMAINADGEKIEIQKSLIDSSLFMDMNKIKDSVESIKQTITTNKGEKNMKELILNALKEAEVETQGLDDTALLTAYQALNVNEGSDETGESADGGDGGTTGIAANEETDKVALAIAAAMAPIQAEVASLKANAVATDTAELTKYSEIVGNSDKYIGLTVDICKTLTVDVLKSLAANCGMAHGISINNNMPISDAFAAPTTAPE